MLANLGNEDDLHAGAASSGQSHTSSGKSMPEIDEMGMHFKVVYCYTVPVILYKTGPVEMGTFQSKISLSFDLEDIL